MTRISAFMSTWLDASTASAACGFAMKSQGEGFGKHGAAAIGQKYDLPRARPLARANA
jgi:hypothetical protein